MRIFAILLFALLLAVSPLALSTCTSNIHVNKIVVASSTQLKINLTYFAPVGEKPIIGAPVTFTSDGFSTTVTTDPLGNAAVTPPPVTDSCKVIKIKYAGSAAVTPECNGISPLEINYNNCPPGQTPVLTGTSAICFPVMILLAILMGAMFLVGKNPLAGFDFTSPRFPRGQMRAMGQQWKNPLNIAGLAGTFMRQIPQTISRVASIGREMKMAKVEGIKQKGMQQQAKVQQADAARGSARGTVNRTAGATGQLAKGQVITGSYTPTQLKETAERAKKIATQDRAGFMNPMNLVYRIPLVSLWYTGKQLVDTFTKLLPKQEEIGKKYQAAMESHGVLRTEFTAALERAGVSQEVIYGSATKEGILRRVGDYYFINEEAAKAAIGQLTPEQSKELLGILGKVIAAQNKINTGMLQQVRSTAVNLNNQTLLVTLTAANVSVDEKGMIAGTDISITSSRDELIQKLRDLSTKIPTTQEQTERLKTENPTLYSQLETLGKVNPELLGVLTNRETFERRVNDFNTNIAPHLQSNDQFIARIDALLTSRDNVRAGVTSDQLTDGATSITSDFARSLLPNTSTLPGTDIDRYAIFEQKWAEYTGEKQPSYTSATQYLMYLKGELSSQVGSEGAEPNKELQTRIAAVDAALSNPNLLAALDRHTELCNRTLELYRADPNATVYGASDRLNEVNQELESSHADLKDLGEQMKTAKKEERKSLEVQSLILSQTIQGLESERSILNSALTQQVTPSQAYVTLTGDLKKAGEDVERLIQELPEDQREGVRTILEQRSGHLALMNAYPKVNSVSQVISGRLENNQEIAPLIPHLASMQSYQIVASNTRDPDLMKACAIGLSANSSRIGVALSEPSMREAASMQAIRDFEAEFGKTGPGGFNPAFNNFGSGRGMRYDPVSKQMVPI